MPNFAIDFVLQIGDRGASERWYQSTASYDTAMADALVVAQARSLLLGNGAALQAVRVSDQAVLRDSVRAFNTATFPKAGASLIRDTPGHAWYVQANINGRYKRQVMLRGIPDDWIRYDVDNNFAPVLVSAFLTALQGYEAALKLKGYAIRCHDQTVPEVPIAGVHVAAGYLWIDKVAHGLQPTTVDIDGREKRTKVRVSRVGGSINGGTHSGCLENYLKGTLEVLEVEDDSFRVNLPDGGATGTDYTKTGVYRHEKFVYVPFTTTAGKLTPVAPTTRDTGGPFFRHRGRSKNRRCGVCR
jgi:hypothetical protein